MRFRTGAVQFDLQVHGGLPAGLVELSGEDACGKTAIALSVVREAGQSGLPCALIHMQGGAPDTNFLRSAGISRMAVSTPPHGEAAVEVAHSCLSRGFRVVVIDSFTNLRPRCEDDLMVGERVPAARLAYHAATVLRERALRADSLLLCTSEVRANLEGYGLISAYERVLSRCSDMRIRLSRQETRAEYGLVTDVTIRMDVLASGISGAGTVSHVHLHQADGVARDLELLLALVRAGTLTQVGAYWKGLSRMFGPGYTRAAQQVGQRYRRYREELTCP
jgi:KaiC/GvpD/RAD55 family RecA-like ATPase